MLLAGPIVRRVTPRSVAVWVATTKPARLRLSIFEGITAVGPGTDTVTATPRNESSEQDTVRVGAGLHVGVVALALPSAQQLLFGQAFSYNVTIRFEGEGPEDLKSLGLLAEGLLDVGTGVQKPHEPLGYQPNDLPSFVVPPSDLDDVRLYHASCRKPHGQDPDALALLDDHIAAERDERLHRPHQLFLTGDQIYADDVPITLLPHLTTTGQELIGVTEELPITATSTVLVNQENLPAGFRQDFSRNAVGFSSDEADSHLVSLGEYCAAYLFSFSNVAWPDMGNRVNGIPPTLEAFDHDIDVVRMSVEGMSDLQDALFRFPDMEEAPTQRRVEFFFNLSDTERQALFSRFDDDFLELPRVHDPQRDPPGLEFLIAEARFLISGVGDAEAKQRLKAFREYTEAFIERYGSKTRSSEKQRPPTVVYYDALPKIRRALANVATYMIFDDHDVTDDWYVSRPWRARVHGRSAGPVVLRNGLVAYGFFQGWGNDPARFSEGFSGTAEQSDDPLAQLKDSTKNFSSLITADVGRKIRNTTDGSEARILAVGDETITTSPLVGGSDNTWAAGDRYEVADGPNLPLLRLAPQLYGTESAPNAATAAALDALLGSAGGTPETRWDYEVPGPTYHVRVLDTRTRREFLGLRDPPNLIDPAALDQQLPPGPLEAGQEVLIVVSAAPVLDLPALEELFKPLLIRFTEIGAAVTDSVLRGEEKFDLESWSANPPGFEALIARLATYRRVLVLSGDVHYAGGVELSYWKGAALTGRADAGGSATQLNDSTVDFTDVAAGFIGRQILNLTDGSAAEILAVETDSLTTTPLEGGSDDTWQDGDLYEVAGTPARVVQFTSSAAKNLVPKGHLIVPASRSHFGQRVIRAGVPLERLGWADADEDPVQVSTTESTPPSLRARLNRSPVLIPTEGWPADTVLDVPPEWRWRLRLLRDVRPDLDRPDPVRPLPLDGPVSAAEPFESYRRVARRHVDFVDKALFARQLVFATNIGRARFDTSGGSITARHDMIGVHREDPLAKPASYTRHEASLAAIPGEEPPTL